MLYYDITRIQYTREIIKHNDELQWTNEHTFFYKNIPLALYSRKGWCFLCVRGELETGTDCYILTQSSSDHSSTTSSSWLGCSTVGHWGPKALSLQAVLTLASCPQLQLELTACLPKAVCGTWLYNCLTYTYFLWAYTSATITEFNHVQRSRWYSDIFDRMHLFRCSSAYLYRSISWLTARSRVNI